MSPKLVYVQCAKECVFSPVSWATLWPNLLPHLVINTRDTKRSMRRVRERVEKSSLKIPEKSSSSCSCEWVCREAAHFSRLIYHSQRWGGDRRPCCVCCISKHTLVSHLPQIALSLYFLNENNMVKDRDLVLYSLVIWCNMIFSRQSNSIMLCLANTTNDLMQHLRN